MLQPEVFVNQEWRLNKNCLTTFPRHLLVLRKRGTEQVLLFAHASLEVLPDPQYLKVSLIFFACYGPEPILTDLLSHG